MAAAENQAVRNGLRQNFYALRRKFYYKLNSDAIRSETEMTTKQYLGHTRNPFILSMIVLTAHHSCIFLGNGYKQW